MAGRSAVTAFCLFVLLLRTDWSITVAAHDETGLISVSCHWTSGSYIDSGHGILWMSEGIIINNSGRCVSLPREMNSQIRIFPEGFRNCYILSTLLGQQYLIRGIFYYGNYDQKFKPPVFNVSIDATLDFQVSTSLNSYHSYEVIVTAMGYNLSYCLTKIPNGGIPLILKLEVLHSQSVAYIGGNTSLVMRKLRHVDNGNGYFLYRSFNNAVVVPENTMDMPVNATVKHPWLKVLVGCSVGASILLFLLFAAVTFACLYKRPEKLLSIETRVTYQSPPNYIARTFCEPEYIELKSLHIHKFSLPELATATNSFSNRIGEGGFGAVYHGTLLDGQAVAVKVWSASSIQGIREFTNEVDLLSGVQHDNLVPLIGYCPQQQILVYHYMSNGSLQDRLYGEAACRKPLDWITRLNIALGAARGLNYLHTAAVRCIIHRDVKSSNILLDDSMVAKVADFGFSKYAPQEDDSIVSLEVRGTAGYMDPEYYSTQQLTVKSDVFSFGVVLLEIVCGREPLNIHRPRPEWSLVEWAKPFIQKSNIEAIVDSVISSSYSPEAMWRVLEIALSSVEPLGAHRPTMADVIRELEDALIIENNASQYMASIESLCSSHMPMGIPVGDAKMPPSIPLFYQFEPSPVFSETLGSPGPR